MVQSAAIDQALFQKTGREVVRRLRNVHTAADAFEVLRWGVREMNRTYGRVEPALKAKVACRSGCHFCCHIPLGVQAHEVLFAAEHIRQTFGASDLADLTERARLHRERVRGLDGTEMGKLIQTCPLLRDNACSIYEARPEVCRAHHSINAKQCENRLITGEPNADIAEIRSRMFSVMLAIDQAVVEAGYDGRAYDFGSALHEALVDTECRARWLAKQAAFPDSCREPIQPGRDQHGEIRKLGLFGRV